MGQRVVRVNELVMREISAVLHSRYQSIAVGITITGVSVAPNLRSADVYYAVVGDAQAIANAGRFFAREKREIKRRIGMVITLKFLPDLHFIYDEAAERGNRLNCLMDEMGLEHQPQSLSPQEPGDKQ
jgi:ribosome-binding factor A